MPAWSFFKKIASKTLLGLFHIEKDNYDFARFLAPEKISQLKLKFYKNKILHCLLWCRSTIFFILHYHRFFKAYQLLNDSVSKKLFIQLIIFKILGHKHILIKNHHDWSKEKELLSIANRYYIAPSKLPVKANPVFGGLNHYENVPTATGTVSLDCWCNGIHCLAMKKQYYFSRGSIMIKPELGDIVIDGGGCFGDTSVFFAKSVGSSGMVYVFEPLPIHGVVIKKNIAQNNLKKNISLLPYALGNKSNHNPFIQDLNSYLNPGFRMIDESNFPIISIDDFTQQYRLPKVDFIKMDIEGCELNALKGAAQVIKRFMPKLAISIYHKKEDFYAIPLWLNQITNSYRYYIDHYTIHAEETVLYAISYGNTSEKSPKIINKVFRSN